MPTEPITPISELEKDFKIADLEEENKTLKEENNRLKNNAMEDMRVQTKLEEENRLLKDKLNAFESSKFNTMALLEIQHPKTAREAENLLQYKKVFERLYNDKLYCLEEENRKLKKELECVYKAYHTAMGVDYDSEEDLYTNEDIEGHNVE